MSSDPPILHHEPATSRRDWLLKSGAGFGAVALTALAASSRQARGETRPPHHAAKAKSVIFLFMEGGPSHIDLFDPKPALKSLAGKPLPESFGSVITAMGEARAPVLADQRVWKQHGRSGIWVSDWLPHTATMVDEIAVIRSCVSDGINHSGGVCQMNTGSILGGRPSLGAWATYGLGSETDDLPAFVVMQDTDGQVVNGPRNWSAGFMPAVYQGAKLSGGEPPIAIVKLDELVTCYVADDPLQRNFVRMVVNLCRARGIRTVAEWTRTIEQMQRLAEDGVDFFQGELLGMPQPPADVFPQPTLRKTHA
jgi:hypothetical protein